MHTKKHGNAVLFNYRNMLELRSKPCFKALLKKHLKNPQNFLIKHAIYFFIKSIIIIDIQELLW